MEEKWQATCITPLRPNTFAAFPPWRIQRELVVQDLPLQIYNPFAILQLFFCNFFKPYFTNPLTIHFKSYICYH